MKGVYRFLIAMVLIVAAIASYSAGSSTGLFAFVVLGFMFEAAFWLRLFPVSKKRKSHA